jgi:hypothetical protein
MSIIDASGLNFSPIRSQLVPTEGPRAIPVLLDFTGSTTVYTLDLLNVIERNFISMLQTIFVDASGTDDQVTITMNGSNQTIVVKGRTQGYYAILAPNPARLTFTSTGSTVRIPVFLINVAVSGVVWATQ